VDQAIIREQALDRLAARLGFGRTCIQICDALLRKLDAVGPHHGPSRGDLEQLRAEDLRHLMTARELIIKLGGDPTVVSPRASMQVPVSASLCQLAADQRTSVADALDTLLVAELVDREAWEQLAAEIAPLCDAELEAQLREVRRAGGEHVVRVRAWLAAAATVARPRG
jgi:hypothetical protein